MFSLVAFEERLGQMPSNHRLYSPGLHYLQRHRWEEGGVANATKMVIERNPSKLQRSVHPDDQQRYEAKLAAKAEFEAQLKAWEANPVGDQPEAPAAIKSIKEPHGITKLAFLTYMFIPYP